MHHRTGRLAARTAGLALLLLIAVPAGAAAADFGPAPATGPMTASIPLLGSTLTVDVSLDGAGALSSVALDPVGDFTATVDRPHAVRFEKADGSVKVTISAWGGHTSLKARAGSLAVLEGSGSWAADLFDTGSKTTVHYTVGHSGTNVPTLKIDSVSAPGAIDVTQGSVKSKSGDGWAGASARIDFAWHGYVKHLTIGVMAGTKGDATSARLQITLTGRSIQKLAGTLASLLGSHTWSGKLCDGTAVSIAFQVVDDGGKGKVTYNPDTFATGADAKARSLRSGFVAWFPEKRAAVLVWLRPLKDGTYKLVVGSFVGKWCKGTTIANPTVNTPISALATKARDGGIRWAFFGFGFGFDRWGSGDHSWWHH